MPNDSRNPVLDRALMTTSSRMILTLRAALCFLMAVCVFGIWS